MFYRSATFAALLATLAAPLPALAQAQLQPPLAGSVGYGLAQTDTRASLGVAIPLDARSRDSRTARPPRVELTLAREGLALDGQRIADPRLGQPLRIGLTLDEQRALTLNGTALRQPDENGKMGISTLGYVAIAVGVAAVAYGGFILWARNIQED